jgi:hypothetical protein
MLAAEFGGAGELRVAADRDEYGKSTRRMAERAVAAGRDVSFGRRASE